MNVICPYCETEHELPEDSVGLQAECSCGAEFIVNASGPATLVAPPATKSKRVVRASKNSRQQRSSSKTKKAKKSKTPLVLFMLLLIVGGVSYYAWQNSNLGQGKKSSQNQSNKLAPKLKVALSQKKIEAYSRALNRLLLKIEKKIGGFEKSLKNKQYTFTLAQHELLRSVGAKQVEKIAGLKQGQEFLNTFLNNQQWMEDFLSSGPLRNFSRDYSQEVPVSYADRALMNLFEIWQFDQKSASNKLYNKLSTGMALAHAAVDEADAKADKYIESYSYYRDNHGKGQLHKMFDSYDVWEMRSLGGKAWVEDVKSFEWYLENINIPLQDYSRGYGGIFSAIKYRGATEFGGNIQAPGYYEPWESQMSFAENRFHNGGVCGSLSNFGAWAARARGILSGTVGSSTHCAYTVRHGRKNWVKAFGGGNGFHGAYLIYGPWSFSSLFLTEDIFAEKARLLNSNRFRWQAQLRSKNSEAFIACMNKSLEEQGKNLRSWDTYIRHLIQQKSHSASDWKQVTVELQTKLQKYPMIAFKLFEAYHRAAGLGEGSDETLKIWMGLHKSAVEGGSWVGHELPEEQKNQSTKNEYVTTELRRVILNHFKRHPQKAEEICRSLLEIYSKSPNGKFDMKTWPLSFLRGEQLRQWLTVAAESATGSNLREFYSKGLKAAVEMKDMNMYRIMSTKAQEYLSDKEKGELKVNQKAPSFKKFSGSLLSEGGMLTLSSTSRWDTPLLHMSVLSEKGGFFHTSKDKNPWAVTRLARYGELSGIVIVNNFARHLQRAVPLEVSISIDGKKWQKIKVLTKAQKVWEIDLTGKGYKARYVRVQKRGKDILHLRNILTFGRRLE